MSAQWQKARTLPTPCAPGEEIPSGSEVWVKIGRPQVSTGRNALTGVSSSIIGYETHLREKGCEVWFGVDSVELLAEFSEDVALEEWDVWLRQVNAAIDPQ